MNSGEKRVSQVPLRHKAPQRKRVCAYVRVSTANEGQKNSLQNQTEYYERVIKSRPDFEYCGIFSDTGVSGAKENRPGFSAMMASARQGEIDVIITKSISRFARNTVVLLRSIRELKELGVEVYFEEQSINIMSAEGELILTLLGSMAEEERNSVSTNIRWSIKTRYKQGAVIIDTNRLIGYDKDKDRNLIINEKQAGVVREIFIRYIKGISAYKIAEQFNEEGIPTWTMHPWSSQRILRIISNEKYMGDCILQKSYIGEDGVQRTNRGQLEKYYVHNNHPAIVSREDWEMAQQLRDGRKAKTYPYTGLLRCTYCGSNLIRVLQEHKYCSWVCSKYMYHAKAACQGIRIPERELEAITKDNPITEPMIVEEIANGTDKQKRNQKNFCIIPAK